MTRSLPEGRGLSAAGDAFEANEISDALGQSITQWPRVQLAAATLWPRVLTGS